MPSVRRILTVERVKDVIERSSPVTSFKLIRSPEGFISVIARCADGTEIQQSTGNVVYPAWNEERSESVEEPD
jgi:hypothetical protein